MLGTLRVLSTETCGDTASGTGTINGRDFFEFPKGFEDAKLAKARGGTVVPGISEAEGTGQATNEACYEIPMECEEAIGDS